MMICPICGKESGIVLLGKLPKDAEAPRQMLGDLCDDCKSKLSDNQCYVLAIDDRNAPTRYAIVDKSIFNIEIKGNVVAMPYAEFASIFIK